MTHSTASASGNFLQMPSTGWRLVTDNVMGGVSTGSMQPVERENTSCIALTGDVSTDNNGGFIQIALDLEDDMAKQAAGYDGIRIRVLGNGEDYNLHLRTRDLWFPWQAYRATFQTTGEWQELELPFSKFAAYKTSSKLRVERLKRIGVVAIGRDFTADICVADVGFYRDKK